MSDQSVITLLEERKRTLKCLFFNGLSLSDESYKHLTICQSLEELGISNAEFMLSSGATAISNLHCLSNLRLNFAQNVTSEDFISLFSHKNLQYLLQLDLSRCFEVDDEVLKTIALNCPGLESLALNGCKKITDQGMKFLIKHCKNIIILYLRAVNKLSDLFLYQVNDNLKNLLYLNLKNHGPKITKFGLEYVVGKSNIGLTIINVDGNVVQSKNKG